MSARLFIDVTDLVRGQAKAGREDAHTARAIVRALTSSPNLNAVPVVQCDGRLQVLHPDDLSRLLPEEDQAPLETGPAASPPPYSTPELVEQMPAALRLRMRAKAGLRRLVRSGIGRLSPEMQEDAVEILHRVRNFGSRPPPVPKSVDTPDQQEIAPETWTPRLGPTAFPSAADVVWMANPAIWQAGYLRARLAMRRDGPAARAAFHVLNAPAMRLAVLGLRDSSFAPVTAAAVDLLDTAAFITAASDDIAVSLASVATATDRRMPAVRIVRPAHATDLPTALAGPPSVVVPVDLCSVAEIGLLAALFKATRIGEGSPVFTISGHPLQEAMPALAALQEAGGVDTGFVWVDEAEATSIRRAAVVLYLQQPKRVWKAAVRTVHLAGAVIARSGFMDHGAGIHVMPSDDAADWAEALLAYQHPAAPERDRLAALALMAEGVAHALEAWLPSAGPRA